MQLPNVPDSVDGTALGDALFKVGIDTRNLHKMTVTATTLELEYVLRDNDGNVLRAGRDEPATFTVRLPVRNETGG